MNTLNKSNYPLRHISIRVPWHDNGWNGTVCKAPQLNNACLKLKNIAQNRNDDAETAVAGQSIQDLQPNQLPCCVAERGTFMADFEYTRTVVHPYAKTSPDTHGHFEPTPIRHSPYSALAIPFQWMLSQDNDLEHKKKEYHLNINLEWEPKLNFTTDWVQDYRNQLPLLDCFFRHIRPEESLCFFYAKEVPFVEDSRRVIIGVGRVKHIGSPIEYKNTNPEKLRCMLWERSVQHSIRPDFKDGFILPYHQAIEFAKKHPEFDPAEITAFAPGDRIGEFSFGAEHVTHDGAIAGLLACAESLNKAKKHIPGNWESCLKWIDDRLTEVWKMRGPCPGLGAALSAFGIELGTFVARNIAAKLEENENPWPLIDKVFVNPKAYLPPQLSSQIGNILQKAWQNLEPERLALLKLLSRFEITSEQAKILYVKTDREKKGIICQDSELLNNPYLIYELTRHTTTNTKISLLTVDRGVFPDSCIQEKHPLPKPSAIDTGIDERRIRAFTVEILEQSANLGDTLVSRSDVIDKIRNMPISPTCEVTEDTIRVAEESFLSHPKAIELVEIETIDSNGVRSPEKAYQLQRLSEMGRLIKNSVRKRIKGKRFEIKENWRKLLDTELDKQINVADIVEEKARQEKTASLQEIAASRISVLIGSAGTGKTTILSALCKQAEIASEGIILLAPTGKARIRLQTKSNVQAYTIAQFLYRCRRYDNETQRYFLSTYPAISDAQTVIIDEASMLTEEMLAALLDAVKSVKRIILVGDPQQLPPIGPGRPFVDIIHEIRKNIPDIESRFPRVGNNYTELTISRRQSNDRDDVRLANWFGGQYIPPGEDDIFKLFAETAQSKHLKFISWKNPEDFHTTLLDVLVKELNLSGINDAQKFDESLGGVPYGNYVYFNPTSANAIEQWQILSPVRNLAFGVTEINRLIHKTFKARTIETARGGLEKQYYKRQIPKPMGTEEIVYGDKVINVVNHKHKDIYPDDADALKYIANGDIGIVVGQFKKKTDKRNWKPWQLQIVFSSQVKHSYEFDDRYFNEEFNNTLELAYCLTVHKAQGSEFKKVIVVLPNPCRLLSKELLYTALTRQQDSVIILHQGDLSELKVYASDAFSETASRLTNLFETPCQAEIFFAHLKSKDNLGHSEKRWLDDRLIHRTIKGEAVRSKSEVIIANLLHHHKIDYVYEQALKIGNITKYPDFTIEDSESGITYYWEHCGLLNDPVYQQRWNAKKQWYRENDILPYSEGGGTRGTLIETSDDVHGGISSQEIEKIIQDVILGY
ncbi:ATP-dependent RecD-like DNA helicase [Anabaena sp. 4-3]|uniref:ATP-dependent DNA helicase n=1 Tax=Anabaena sp. 4-3 TaxID=1811979 RepID=UPI00083028B9|nr:AAA family ATPase [Anabaena sp. 4-3]